MPLLALLPTPVTHHTLSVAVIVCELTGQLTPILPVLIAMLMGNAICKFLQPSIYESIIRVKKYPYLPELPPSRFSVHTVKVEQIMVEAQAGRLSLITPQNSSSAPKQNGTWLSKRNSARRQEQEQRIAEKALHRAASNRSAESAPMLGNREEEQYDIVPDRTSNGNTHLSISPLHAPNNVPLHAVFTRPSNTELHKDQSEEELLNRTIDLDEIAIDSAPFQLVHGSSLYKVHSLFSLLGLSHAYVSDRGRLIGVVGLKELRDALAHIYLRGVLPAKGDRKLTSGIVGVIPKQEEETQKDEEVTRRLESKSNGITIQMDAKQTHGNSRSVP
ncbi:unnamed protein product, partial [Mesorhabditis spiculigera]